MATFSENQVRHLFVVNSATDIEEVTAATGKLVFTNAKGEKVPTDVITNVIYAKKTLAAAMARTTKAVKITMTGTPVAGETYLVRIHYRQFIGQSDEEFYQEFGSAYAETGMATSVLLGELAKNLALNTKKQELVKVVLMGATTKSTSVTSTAFSASATYAIGDLVTYTDNKLYVFKAEHDGAWSASDVEEVTSIVIEELEQPWVRGVIQETPVLFDVVCSPITYNAVDTEWATITDVTGTTIGNGKKIADMEYFYMGNRGDQYRMMGYPNVIFTDYKVNPATTYDVFDIHYAYVGDNHAVQKSEKTLTVVVDSTASLTSTVEGYIETAFGITI